MIDPWFVGTIGVLVFFLFLGYLAYRRDHPPSGWNPWIQVDINQEGQRLTTFRCGLCGVRALDLESAKSHHAQQHYGRFAATAQESWERGS